MSRRSERKVTVAFSLIFRNFTSKISPFLDSVPKIVLEKCTLGRGKVKGARELSRGGNCKLIRLTRIFSKKLKAIVLTKFYVKWRLDVFFARFSLPPTTIPVLSFLVGIFLFNQVRLAGGEGER